jgi:hypothetical protein
MFDDRLASIKALGATRLLRELVEAAFEVWRKAKGEHRGTPIAIQI